jgi:hypothetical protein
VRYPQGLVWAIRAVRAATSRGAVNRERVVVTPARRNARYARCHQSRNLEAVLEGQ